MSENYFTRSFDLIPADKIASNSFVIFGCGSIGSYTALALAKAGFKNLTLLDHDTVDVENIGPQFYKPEQVGESKVNCLDNNLYEYTRETYHTLNQKFTYNELVDLEELSKLVNANTTVVCAIDSMKARKHLFNLLKDIPFKAFIDSRMAIESLDIYAFCKEHTKTQGHYSKTLFSDADAVQAPCTNKAISYTSLIAGGVIAKLCKDAMLDKLTTYSVKMDIATMSTDILEIKE